MKAFWPPLVKEFDDKRARMKVSKWEENEGWLIQNENLTGSVW